MLIYDLFTCKDIECCSASKAFPEPDRPHDYVISIASYVTVQGSSEPLVKSVFTLRGCSSIVGAQVLSFDTEKDMLVEWAEFIQIVFFPSFFRLLFQYLLMEWRGGENTSWILILLLDTILLILIS